MPDLSPFAFPEGAAEAVAAKAASRDYYGNLTEEERVEEGLPPKDAPGGAAAGGDDDKGETDGADAPEAPDDAGADGAEEEEEEAGDDLTGQLFEDIASLKDGLNTLLGRDDEPQSRSEEKELLEAALEHDDPVVRGLAAQLQEAQKALAEVKADAMEQRVARQIAKDAADFDAVAKSYTIAGAPMTDAHVEAVEKYILDNPEIGRKLTIEQITRVVHPDAVKVERRTQPGKNGRPAATGGPKVATVITEGGTGGAPSGPWKPRANETIESAVAAAAERFGWKR